jgi:hypothetical protein
MYYSNIAERILPIVDILFLRCFEVGVDKSVVETFLKAFAPIYRYHRECSLEGLLNIYDFLAQPVTYLYKLAYMLDGHLSAEGPSLARFVTVICKKLDEEKNPRYPFLTPEFMGQQHNVSWIRRGKVMQKFQVENKRGSIFYLTYGLMPGFHQKRPEEVTGTN